MDAILRYEWPGNLRELENMMRRLLVIQDPEELAQQLQSARSNRPTQRTATVPGEVIRFQPAAAVSSVSMGPAVQSGSPILEKVNEAKRKAETEAICVRWTLRAGTANRRLSILRIDYKALLYKMRKLDIEQSAGALRSAAGGA